MLKYTALSKEIQDKIINDREKNIENPYRCNNDSAIRRNNKRDAANLWRPSYIRDIEKILHCPFYNRYADKTQVFSFYRNDDITRRALHVQLVSRISRNIGRLLGLNLDLIEAIALGHDIGHTPFGHAGEKFLNELLLENTDRFFNHNVHSVRVFDTLFVRNLSLQTLDGILCHNGEFEQKEYRPSGLQKFEIFDEKVEDCYIDKSNIDKLIPSTLEGCVVRICDMIAYLGKDRQDAKKANLLLEDSQFTKGTIGVENAQIINNLTVNIIENSYGKDYIQMDKEIFEELKTAKRENYEIIYQNERIDQLYNENIKPMFRELYYKLLKDIKSKSKDSVIYKHHIQFIENNRRYYYPEEKYIEQEPNQIVVDYIASMTDDYFVDLYNYLFPNGKYKIKYISYFDNL
ncbi:deoxyguanosinetriphosphate triphosphohydrolase family protein [Anaerovorax odorimutans]|uniref:deoxyguanosinetriphosphate triphosphohydrolase family protein n=1 Tax=Anaerovorax odorimutans TaxID=109327 RepID=UPI000403E7C1|nr:HD domain-containing protein [Anaerovorax odorimutans]